MIYTTRSLTVGGVTMATGSGAVDGNGVRWVLESLTGWDGSPAPVADITQKVGASGVWLGPAFYGPRIIEIIGSVGTDWETANGCIDQLNTALPIADTATLTVSGAGPDLQADVRNNGEVLVAGSQSSTRFSLSLIAPDPRKYSTTLTSGSTGLPITSGGLSLPIILPISIGATETSGRLSFTNDGNEISHPILSVTGPCPPFTITHLGTGRQITALNDVPAGRILYLDTQTKEGLLDGTALRVTTGAWFDFAPGLNELQFNATSYSAAARLAATFRSARR